MNCRGWLFIAALVLSGCGGDTSEVAEQEDGQDAVAGSQEIRCFTATDDLPARRYKHSVLAFGDSLFAGYGLCPDQGYPEQLQLALQKRGIDAQVIDAGVSGDTTAAGRQRIAFVLDSAEVKPDLVIVELGGNDLLRGIPPAQTRANLAAILDELRKREIPALLMGMRAPPNLGEAFVAEFDGLYPALAREYGAALVPFFMEPVYDRPALMQQDRIHPTAAGVQAMVDATVGDVARALPETK